MTALLFVALLAIAAPCYPTPLTSAQVAANAAAEHPPCRKNTGWAWVFNGDGCAPVDRVPYPPCPPASPTPKPSHRSAAPGIP